MLKVYIKDDCAYCDVVMEALQKMNLKAQVKNAKEPGATEEVIGGGGKVQFPFLLDDSNGVGLYETDLILEYLSMMYGDGERLTITES